MKQTTAMSELLQYDLILFEKLGTDNRKDKKYYFRGIISLL